MSDNTFKELMLEEYNRLKNESPDSDPTAWDVLISLVGDDHQHILVMKADLPIVESLAEGNSIIRTSRKFDIPSKAVRRTADLWGITPMDTTLDFNPLLVYNRGMSAEEMRSKLSNILFENLDLETYKNIISNIDRYLDMRSYLDEFGDNYA